MLFILIKFNSLKKMKKLLDFIPQDSWKGLEEKQAKNLLFAVLRQALLDMLRPCKIRPCIQGSLLDKKAFQRLYNAFKHDVSDKLMISIDWHSYTAWKWFFSTETDHIASFHKICKCLGADPAIAQQFDHAYNMAEYFVQKLKKEEEPCQSNSLPEPLKPLLN